MSKTLLLYMEWQFIFGAAFHYKPKTEDPQR